MDECVYVCRLMMYTGWVGLCNKPAQSSSSIIQVLESMGAVLYVKTNIPQSLMVCFPLFPSCMIYLDIDSSI